jgi:hypothetical protein
MKRLPGLVPLFLLLASTSSCGEQQPKPHAIRMYVTPYYDSEGLQVNVGKFSKELASMTKASAQKTQQSLKSAWGTLSPETMYVAAIRLYDLGLKDDSAYWFYSAQYRAILFRRLLDPAKIGEIGSKAFELQQAYAAFHQLAGEYINGYAWGEPLKLAATVSEVQREGKTLPDVKTIYPDVFFADRSQWSKVNEEVNSGMTGLIDTMKNNGDEIKAKRKAAGIEGKY